MLIKINNIHIKIFKTINYHNLIYIEIIKDIHVNAPYKSVSQFQFCIESVYKMIKNMVYQFKYPL